MANLTHGRNHGQARGAFGGDLASCRIHDGSVKGRFVRWVKVTSWQWPRECQCGAQELHVWALVTAEHGGFFHLSFISCSSCGHQELRRKLIGMGGRGEVLERTLGKSLPNATQSAISGSLAPTARFPRR